MVGAAIQCGEQALDQRLVMCGYRLDPLGEQVLERRRPWNEVEEVRRAEDVVGSSAEIVPQAMLALDVEVELDAIG